MTIRLTEKVLKDAVIRAARYDMDSLPPDSQIDHEFSPEFIEKMRVLIQQSKKMDTKTLPVWRRKLVVGIAAILVLLSIAAMTITPVRAKIHELIQEIYKQYTHISFSGSGNTADDTAFRQTMPTYIPEGFNLVIEDLEGTVLLFYEKGIDNISYEQIRIRDVSKIINTEGVELEELEFQGFPAQYYSNQGEQSLMWCDDEYFYTVSSTLDRDTVFKIAESVQPKEN